MKYFLREGERSINMRLRKTVVLALVLLSIVAVGDARLRVNFYASTCPDVESIVRQTVEAKISETIITIASTLRLFFHDCFVEGCDASVLIFSPTGDAEKDAGENQSLAGDGFDTVARAKAAVEDACPGVVSCADVLAIAARDVVVAAGGPGFPVELGRLDGLVSAKGNVAGNLPEPTLNLNQLIAIFRKNNLSTTDIIALSGAHTVGAAHCVHFSNRLQSDPIDPTLNPDYAQELLQECPANADPDAVVQLDPATPFTFDNAYYRNLINGKGLLTSDQVLFTDSISKPTVLKFAKSQSSFFKAFTAAMIKLGRTGVKTGTQGEIRTDCSRFN
ncbi:peroxidase superfamily protein [Wolffia australiana]